MKRTKTFILILPIALAMLAVGSICFAETMSVQVKKSPLRNSPSFLGKMIGEVFYGQELKLIEKNNSWLKMRTESGAGWLHSSALTSKEISLQAGADDVSRTADTGEMALAGKGFNPEVEKEFRKNSELNYKDVDQIEGYEITMPERFAFVRAGGLSGAEEIK